MANLLNMEKRITMDLREAYDFASTTDESRAQVHLAIRDAILSMEDKEFFFNVGSFEFTTVAGQTDYGASAITITHPTAGLNEPTPGFLYVIGEFIYMAIEGNLANVLQLERLTPQDWQDRFQSEASTVNQPLAFDFWRRVIRLIPPSDTSTHKIRGRCLVDLGANVATWDGAAWTFSTGTLTNAWFTFGEEMIRARACYLFCKNYKKDPTRAMQFLERQLEKQSELMSMTAGKTSADGQIQGWL